MVRDTGVGFPEDLDFRDTTSLGWQLICVLADQLGGSIDLKRDNGRIVTITLTIPEEDLAEVAGG
jgi:two-component sensor histidine kinase